jgi:hypothetical protein
MNHSDIIIESIRRAFEQNVYPGDDYIQGSTEGSEPFDEVGPFSGEQDWRALGADFLDVHAGALGFFSEAGFRFFLPAYLIADLQGQLNVADPLFFLTHGFHDIAVEVPAPAKKFITTVGRSQLVNPRRYGAMTFYDYARYRLSAFTREESEAIAAYLKYRRDTSEEESDKERIQSALDSFWLERAREAPLAKTLRQHLVQEDEFLDALRDEGEPPLD